MKIFSSEINVKFNFKKTLKFLFLALILFLLKITFIPIYWPGGDYQNHIQNALEFLYRIHWSLGLGGYNAWWQPIGPGLYFAFTGSLIVKSFYPFIFFQCLMIASFFLILFFFCNPKNKLHKCFALIISLAMIPGLFFYLENAAHVGNFLFQTICILFLVEQFNEKKNNRLKFFIIGLLLAVCNSFRGSGFPILFFYFFVIIFTKKKEEIFCKKHGDLLIGYILLNIIIGFYSNPRYEARYVDKACYNQFVSSYLNDNKKINDHDDLNYLSIEAPSIPKNLYPKNFDNNELKFFASKTPNYITYENALKNNFKCTDLYKFNFIKLIKMALVGDSPPREGRQLMISLQSIPERFYRNNDDKNIYFFSNIFKDEIKKEFLKIKNKKKEYSLYNPSEFVFKGYKDIYYSSIKEFINTSPSNEKLKKQKYITSSTSTIFGEETIHNSNLPLVWTIVEGFLFIKLSNITGPNVQNQIYNKNFKEMISNHPILTYVFFENIFCNLIYTYSPTFKLNTCNMAQFTNIDSILKTPQFRKNSTNGLPESMADELVDNNIHIDKHNNIKLLYLIYVLSASFIGIVAILVLFLSIFQIFQNKNIRKKIIFLYLILFFKIFFLGALGSTGDYLRYGDETRLIIILISALLVKSYSLTRKVKLQKK